MSLSAAELALVAAELGQALPGGHIQKISFVDPQVAFVEVRVPGRSLLVRLDTTEGTAHVGVTDTRPAAPEKALAIQGLWRSQLMGARVESVQANGGTLFLALSTTAGARFIALTLSRKGGSLALLNEHRHLLGITPPDRSWPRGTPWAPPALEEQPRLNRLQALQPDPAALPVSHEAVRLHALESATTLVATTRSGVLSTLRAARKRLSRTVAKVEADRQRIEEAARYQQYGDLLKPMLSRLKRGATAATLTAYGPEGVEEIEVPLLPQLGPRENMERYYHLHRRLTRATGRVEERLQLLREQLTALDGLVARAEAAADPVVLSELLQNARDARLLTEASLSGGGPEGTQERIPYREFFSAAGQRLWVGRNAKDNDALTFRHARGNDLWLHARGQTGSHVVVPGLTAQGTDGETLLDAAELAAHFSAGRDETLVEVASTRAKYVRKVKGGAPGAVTFSQEKTIQLRREPERLARLLASERKR